MTWQTLKLRTRILIGYGIVLALAGGLALFLTAQVSDLNARIASINASSAADAEFGAAMAAAVTGAQQAVDRWLQDPRERTKADATAALDQLAAQVERTRPALRSPAARARLAELEERFTSYRATAAEVGIQLDQQVELRRALRTALFQTSSVTNNYAAAIFSERDSSKFTVLQLFDAQDSLQVAAILIDRLVVEQDSELATQAEAQLHSAHSAFRRELEADPTDKSLQAAVQQVSAAISATQQLDSSLAYVRALRTGALLPQSQLVKESADAIASEALGALTAATADLERQAARTQQLAALALLACAGVSLLAGLRVSRHLVRPLTTLAAAVERVNDGDYTTSVPAADGAEIGRLARAFNQMTATLHAQREQVRAQQGAAEQRAAELEHALQDLQSAQQAQAALAASVRAMSVPVVPILRSVIVVPLVGEIDAARADVVMQRVLAGVTDERARIVILDITGVPFVDDALAALLLQAAQAVELLGARCLLVGISPEVAQALVSSGADLGRLRTYADLRAGVAFALEAAGARA